MDGDVSGSWQRVPELETCPETETIMISPTDPTRVIPSWVDPELAGHITRNWERYDAMMAQERARHFQDRVGELEAEGDLWGLVRLLSDQGYRHLEATGRPEAEALFRRALALIREDRQQTGYHRDRLCDIAAPVARVFSPLARLLVPDVEALAIANEWVQHYLNEDTHPMDAADMTAILAEVTIKSGTLSRAEAATRLAVKINDSQCFHAYSAYALRDLGERLIDEGFLIEGTARLSQSRTSLDRYLPGHVHSWDRAHTTDGRVEPIPHEQHHRGPNYAAMPNSQPGTALVGTWTPYREWKKKESAGGRPRRATAIVPRRVAVPRTQ